MLYVFLVDTGKMYTLPMTLAVESVWRLQCELHTLTGIAEEKQVLLISGGDTLEKEEDVGKYNAGTDTNPIFLFALNTLEDNTKNNGDEASKNTLDTKGYSNNHLLDLYDAEQSLVEQELESLWNTLQAKVDAALMLGSSQSTLSHNASLASELVSITSKQISMCEAIISSQHLQHQGWQAVMANLEDSFSSFARRASKMSEVYQRYLGNRNSYQELIEAFDDDIAMLHRIPVFNVLVEEGNGLCSASGKKDKTRMENVLKSEQHLMRNDGSESTLSLLDWINSRGSHESLEQLADSCYRSVEKLDAPLLERLQAETKDSSLAIQDSSVKEIRGLSERLQSLEHLLQEAKGLEREQQDLAQSLIQNHKRASGLKDDSVLPDLCASHRQQLLVMKKNYTNVASIRKRCLKGKEELSENLRIRLQWVVFVQNKMADVGQTVWMHLEELRRLHKKLEIIEQLHAAPSIYVTTVVEVVRRRAFSSQFLKLANQTSEHFERVHSSETEMRLNFQSKLRKHFLSKLFPGMNDLPPDFAVVKPETFDQNLPPLSLKDVELLRHLVPDLTSSLQLPSSDQALTQKSLTQVATGNIEECSADIGSVSVMHTLIHNSNRRSRSRMHNRKMNNNNTGLDSDSESDNGDNEKSRRNHQNNNRRKLTRSLDDSCLFLDKNGEAVDGEKKKLVTTTTTTMTTMTMTEYVGHASSSTSVDPSSSSANTGTNTSSVVPSSCSTSGQRHDVFCGQETRQKLESFKQELKTFKDAIYSNKVMIDEEIQRIRDTLKLKAVNLGPKEREDENEHKKTLEANENLKVKLEAMQNHLDKAESSKESLKREMEQIQKESIDKEAKDKSEIERLRREWGAEVSDLKREQGAKIEKLTAEKQSELSKLHSELNHLRQCSELEPQVQSLKQELSLRESEMDMLKRKTRLLEASQEERFSVEKEKIVHILEAGFAQREKLAVEKSSVALEKAHRAQLEDMERLFESRLDKERVRAREELRKEHETSIQNLKTSNEEKVEKALVEQKERLEKYHKASLAIQEDVWRRRVRQEVDTLRNRFKMMHTAGALDRSPSTSESELPLEQQSPRQLELAESLRRTLMNEYESALKCEREVWESKVAQLESDHRAAMDQLKADSLNRSVAEQQVSYNEALKRVTEEKDRELRSLEKENEELRLKLSSNSQMMLHSTLVVDESGMSSRSLSTADMQRLRAENEQLKAQLTTSMTSLVENGKVSVRSLERGDRVLVMWSEEHNNFAIFNESNALVFLHCDSLRELDLLDGSGRPKRRHVTAEVLHKEYCQAKKSDNRYRVAQGTRFYRVKCRRIEPTNEFI